MADELLYYIPAGQYGKEGVLSLLAQHPEIKFVSVVGIDLAGNDTDEKIPIRIFKENYDDFFAGRAVQTDGSSVVLMNIATLNDARVDMVTDSSVTGTLIIIMKTWMKKQDFRLVLSVFLHSFFTMTDSWIPELFLKNHVTM